MAKAADLFTVLGDVLEGVHRSAVEAVGPEERAQILQEIAASDCAHLVRDGRAKVYRKLSLLTIRRALTAFGETFLRLLFQESHCERDGIYVPKQNLDEWRKRAEQGS